MGLDITAYRQLRKLREVATEDDRDTAYENGWLTPYPNPDFRGRFEGLDEGWFYEATETDGFCAGSYSGYNAWRRQLAAMVDLQLPEFWEAYDPEKPFAELIHFSDCEGTIGPVASARISAAFVANAELAEQHAAKLEAQEAEWFLGKYAEWRKAFEMAADSGCVEFH